MATSNTKLVIVNIVWFNGFKHDQIGGRTRVSMTSQRHRELDEISRIMIFNKRSRCDALERKRIRIHDSTAYDFRTRRQVFRGRRDGNARRAKLQCSLLCLFGFDRII